MRATAAAMSRLEVSDSSIRSVSSSERKPRHHTDRGQRRVGVARAVAIGRRHIDGSRYGFRSAGSSRRATVTRRWRQRSRRARRCATRQYRTLRPRPTHTDRSKHEKNEIARQDSARAKVQKRLATSGGPPNRNSAGALDTVEALWICHVAARPGRLRRRNVAPISSAEPVAWLAANATSACRRCRTARRRPSASSATG